MNKNTITIKVTGTIEEINLVTDYFPVEDIEWVTGRLPNSNDPEKYHRFIYLDKEKIEKHVTAFREQLNAKFHNKVEDEK